MIGENSNLSINGIIKENTRLQSIKDTQHFDKKSTKCQIEIFGDRNHKVDNYMSKVIDYCSDNNIEIFIIGYNETF